MIFYDSVLLEYSGGGNIAMLDVGVSPMCEEIFESYGEGILYIEDAIDRVLEEIDYLNRRIKEAELGHEELWSQALEDPIAMDYEMYHRQLENNREHYRRTRDILQKDLENLRGAEIPF